VSFLQNGRCVSTLRLGTNAGPRFYFDRVLQNLAWILIIQKAEVSAPKNKKNAPAGESENQRPKRRKDRLIRLDDLIPKQDVMGGHQLLFGASDTTEETTNKEN
jgi:hypothetical protein